jgi:hypothetical protein
MVHILSGEMMTQIRRGTSKPQAYPSRRRQNVAMGLDFLDFDFSDDEQGHGSFDAMACATPAQLPALEREIMRVLDWAHGNFPGAQGALEAGGEWDLQLHGTHEVATPLHVRLQDGRLALEPDGAGLARVTLSLTITGTPGFCEAFREAFGLG